MFPQCMVVRRPKLNVRAPDVIDREPDMNVRGHDMNNWGPVMNFHRPDVTVVAARLIVCRLDMIGR